MRGLNASAPVIRAIVSVWGAFGSWALAQSSQVGRVVEVVGVDYAFRAPDSIPAGLTTFVFRDRGPSAEHQVVLFRLDDSISLARFHDLMASRPATPPGIVALGGIQSDRVMHEHALNPELPGVPGPFHTTDRFTIVLTPGRYVLACMHALPGGGSHIAMGMFRGLTVVSHERAQAALPRAAATLTMAEYSYTLSSTLPTGPQLLRVENAGTQDHQFLLQRLAPGKTLADVRAWNKGGRQGPAPISQVFIGTTRLSPGQAMEIPLDLAVGDYAMICLVPDAGDGLPHLQHGMAGVLAVR